MPKRLNCTISAREAGKRLDGYLQKRLPCVSRAFLQSCIFGGLVTVNGVELRKSAYRLRVNDRITIRMPEKIEGLAAEARLAIPIIYEDGKLLVLNKPSGVSVHPATTQGTGTVANWLTAYHPPIREIGDSTLRPGIMHRLDKGTSGVLIVAKTPDTFAYLKRLFAERRMQKEYVALVEGIFSPSEGTLEGYITPSQKSYRKKKLALLPLAASAKASSTGYEMKQRCGTLSLVRFFPLTGRTHQIRVHAAAAGYPIAGDALYGAKIKIPHLAEGRFLLHAARLSFELPDGKAVSFEAPLPDDFKEALATFCS